MASRTSRDPRNRIAFIKLLFRPVVAKFNLSAWVDGLKLDERDVKVEQT